MIDEARIQRAMESILMDESVTEELVDDEADVLLRWGEQQVSHLASRFEDEAVFDEAAVQLRKLMRNVNQLVGLRADLDDEQQRTILSAIVTMAQGLGYAVTQEIAEAFLQQQPGENIDAVHHLTGLITAQAAGESPDVPAADSVDDSTDEPAADDMPDEPSWLM